MVAGTYGDFSSQNIVNDNNLKDPVSILMNMAFESFKAEQQFYLQIGMPEKFCQSAEQTTELLKSSGTFKEYQEELCLRVFGASHEEYKFLKYFYDSNFIKALSAQTPGSDLLKSLSTDLLKYYRAIGIAENENNINDIDFDFEDFGYEGVGIVHVCHCSNCGAEIEYRVPCYKDGPNSIQQDN